MTFKFTMKKELRKTPVPVLIMTLTLFAGFGSTANADDSTAVHAGLVAVGETKTVTIRILPGRDSYPSTTRNGVTTTSFGSWQGSYEFVR